MDEPEKIIEKCQGCSHVCGDCCCVYISPAAKWRNGLVCPMVAKVSEEIKPTGQKQRVGQQHAQKKAKISKKQQTVYSRIGERKK